MPKLLDIYSQKLMQTDATAVFFFYLYCGENHHYPTGTVNVVGKKTNVYSYPQAKSPNTHTHTHTHKQNCTHPNVHFPLPKQSNTDCCTCTCMRMSNTLTLRRLRPDS
ncbi:hypothetical protein ILYODFUR_032048 [Ilyodon furcidens]|uniref:Uncharacterized protein n=1 Tax=Ilyodon furcidens TaxID=33524 RepID=A0ABV0TZV3_9TELE